jgi:hypothetical protein
MRFIKQVLRVRFQKNTARIFPVDNSGRADVSEEGSGGVNSDMP